MQADAHFVSLSCSRILINLPSFPLEKAIPLIELFLLADLENFKTRVRSTVSVRQGQGMVLLCGPPPHSGGKATASLALRVQWQCERFSFSGYASEGSENSSVVVPA